MTHNNKKKNRKSPRRCAREYVVQALYEMALNTNTPAPEIANHIRSNENFHSADKDLFTEIFFGAHKNREEYFLLMKPYLSREVAQITPVESSVLLMATHELKAMPETPYAVIINEAIEVAKTFGGTDSHKFINSVLDKLIADLRPHEINHSAY